MEASDGRYIERKEGWIDKEEEDREGKTTRKTASKIDIGNHPPAYSRRQTNSRRFYLLFRQFFMIVVNS